MLCVGPECEARETDGRSCRGSAGSLGDGQARGTEGGTEGPRRRNGMSGEHRWRASGGLEGQFSPGGRGLHSGPVLKGPGK